MEEFRMSHTASLRGHVTPMRRRPALAQADEALRRKPLPAVALAIVVGFLLATLATPAR
jgi:ElaB/YqjD/DUF883 family membrane-anchored ribosome-binding protein